MSTYLNITKQWLFNWIYYFFLQGEKNSGFDVLYHNMKYGLVASKELAEFLRERWDSSLVVVFQNKFQKNGADFPIGSVC